MKQVRKHFIGFLLAVVLSAGMTLSIGGCSNNTDNPKPAKAVSAKAVSTYTVKEYPLERNGVKLHLDCTTQDGKKPAKKPSYSRRYIFISRVRCQL